MPPSSKSLGINNLSLAERVMLVEEIWDSIAAEADALEMLQSHKGELDLRLADHNADPGSGSSWEDVKTRLQK